jgi:hypothetical protein
MAAAADGDETVAVEDGGSVRCGTGASDLLCDPAYQSLQLIDAVGSGTFQHTYLMGYEKEDK